MLDASSPFLAQQRASVRATLGALELPPALLSGCIEVYTKADLLDEEARRQWRDALEEEPPVNEQFSAGDFFQSMGQTFNQAMKNLEPKIEDKKDDKQEMV